MRTKILRGNWLIYPRFQLLLILFNALVVSIGFAGVTAGLMQFFRQLHKTGMDSGLSQNHYYFVFLGTQSSRLYYIIAFAWLASVLISAIFTLLISHRIVGPIVRLRSHCAKIAEGGPVTNLNFRKNDFFADLSEAVNGALKKR